jgi:secondary thiamine-phosphate synthase enzyme
MDRRFVKENALKIVLHRWRNYRAFAGSCEAKTCCSVARRELIASVPTMAVRVHNDRFEVRTKGKGTYEITDQVQRVVESSDIATGTVTVFLQHTSCSLVVMENAAPAARRDLEHFFEQLVPEDAHYEHDDEGPDDSTSHIRMALTRTSEVIPVVKARMQLGTWQGLFLFEHRRAPHRRNVIVAVIGE